MGIKFTELWDTNSSEPWQLHLMPAKTQLYIQVSKSIFWETDQGETDMWDPYGPSCFCEQGMEFVSNL